MPANYRLSRPARLLIAGNTVGALGTGLVLPLNLIYLHQVRGIPLPVVGVLLTLAAATGLAAVPVSGMLLDRVGARRVLTGLLIGQALAEAGLAGAHSAATALPAVLLFGATIAPTIPAVITMQAGLIPQPALQQRAFAVNFTGVNAGIGVGSAIGAAVADVQHLASFQILFLTNTLLCLVFAVLLTRLPNVRAPRETDQPKAGYRDVLAHRELRMVILVTLVLAFTGYAALDSGLPAYATVEAHLSVHVVALSLAVNTAIIVGGQLVVLRLVRRLRRSRALSVVGLIWAVSWAVFGLSGLPLSPGLRIACVFSFAALFGLGETFMAPTVSPLVNSLADDRVRGRANSLASATYSVAFVVSPALSIGMIAAGIPVVWLGLLCAGCLTTVLLGVRLGRQLSPAQDRVGDDTPVAVEVAPAAAATLAEPGLAESSLATRPRAE